MTDSADALPADTLPTVLRVHHPGAWRRLGKALVRWNVFDLYELSVFTAGNGQFPDGDHAIEAEYRRPIAGAVIVEATQAEMRRTGCGPLADDPATQSWLQRALPDVMRRDRLLAVVRGGIRLHIYHNDFETAVCEDVGIVRAFAGTWLGPHARLPVLRSVNKT